jgi:hypothetical protein
MVAQPCTFKALYLDLWTSVGAYRSPGASARRRHAAGRSWPRTAAESFLVEMKDQAAVRHVRDSTIHDALKAMPSVSDVVIRCTSVDECKENMRRKNSPTPGQS